MNRKSSVHISLVLAGMMAISGCGKEEKRHMYRSKQECIEDWGSEKECEEMDRRHSSYRSGYYWGPRYYGSSVGSRARSVGTASISRGGFGGLSMFHGSGG